jgi:hypothetical protein
MIGAATITVWTLLVAIASGLSGGLLATWLRTRHERTEAFRDRQITAADDLTTGLVQASIALDDAHTKCLKNGFQNAQGQFVIRHPETGAVADETSDALKEANRAIDEAGARSARVALLFGPTSPADRTVTLAVIRLQDSLSALERWPRPDLKAYRETHSDARRDLRKFNERALAEIQGRPWFSRWRLALWVRRQLRAAWAKVHPTA